MGRERQKQKNRSSRPKVKPTIIGRTKAGKKKVSFLGNETIAKNWDRSQTLEQNYKRLGLSTKLNSGATGLKRIKGRSTQIGDNSRGDSLAIPANNLGAFLKPQEVEVERDPETGRILRIIDSGETLHNSNPLNDPLNDLSEDEEDFEEFKETNDVVAQLEAQVEREAEVEAKRKRPRQQSSREQDWLAKLVEVHGDNTAAMVRDRKLNPMQQSEGDIRRRIKKMNQKQPST